MSSVCISEVVTAIGKCSLREVPLYKYIFMKLGKGYIAGGHYCQVSGEESSIVCTFL